jgi:hypothetical protein
MSMDPSTRNTLRTAEQAVTRLVEQCRKPGPLYRRHPKAVAQVSRTGKWLLNALAALHRELNKPSAPADESAG